jgi:hypothetical protein
MKAHYGILVSAVLLIAAIPLLGQSSGNCFLGDFIPKSATLPPFQVEEKTSTNPTVTVTMNANDTLEKVSKYLYGNNSNTWIGQIVTESNLLNYINLLSPNIIRAPGGNISNVYFWDANVNQPPSDVPDSLYDSNGNKVKAGWNYGRNTQSWTLSLDNYYQMLSITHNTGIICVNFSYSRYGTGLDPVATAAHYAAEWVRYDDGRTKFWEVGNEDFGPWQAGFKIDTLKNHDGQPQIISGTIYGKHFKVFADSMRKAAQDIGSTIYIGAQLIEDPAGNYWNPPTRTWNNGFFSRAGNAADFFIVHSYYTNYGENSTAAVILNSATAVTTNIMNNMKQTTNDNHVLLKPIALTEWNIFSMGSKQMTSFVNGIHAATVLGELARNGFSMSSRWDLANAYDSGNDHGMFNAGDEPGVPKWNPRPAFFYMYYFQKFFGDHIVSASVTGSTSVLAYASRFGSGHAGIVVVNKGITDQVVKLLPKDFGFGEQYYVYSLRGGSDNGEFSQNVYVNENGPTNATGGPIEGLEGIPAWAYPTGDEIKLTSPARSVQYVLIEPGVHTIVSVEGRTGIVDKFNLRQNYPNPFNPRTTISYSLPRVSTVSLRVYDMMGREVATLAHNEKKAAGDHEVSFDAVNLPSGVYYYRLQTEFFMEIKKMMLIK